MKARKINRVFLISGIVLFLLFLYIYWIQIEYKFGDIPSHIATALELKGYTINKYVVNFIISKANLGNFGMALFLALIGICTLIATYSLIKNIGSMCSNQVDDAVAWIISCFVPFFFSLFVPKLYPYFYANTISPNAWHNLYIN